MSNSNEFGKGSSTGSGNAFDANGNYADGLASKATPQPQPPSQALPSQYGPNTFNYGSSVPPAVQPTPSCDDCE
jgi:hypothetical protein